MHKLTAVLMLALAMLMGALALADDSRIVLELPEDALMVESFEFEDGDYIQTYQMQGGVTVQMLRYSSFDMTLEELTEGEWDGYTNLEKLEIAQIDGYPAQGVRLSYAQDSETGRQMVDVYTIMIDAQGQKLIFQAVFPQGMGKADSSATVETWLKAMTIENTDTEDVG